MDMYVRMYEKLKRREDDNPTIGLILSSERNEAVAQYSVLSESKQLFSSKYLTALPTEEELKLELRRERSLMAVEQFEE
jgi:YhcG PDDEXK nuclease domain